VFSASPKYSHIPAFGRIKEQFFDDPQNFEEKKRREERR